MVRSIFYVSDGTGITAETIGNSLTSQFDTVQFRHVRMPFLDTEEKAVLAVERIRRAWQVDGARPVVVNTIIDERLNSLLKDSGALFLDVFAAFMEPLERELGLPRSLRINEAHGRADSKVYETRIDAINYSLAHDDGVSVNYDESDLVLLGVSRSGKTPTCLYMALQYGVKAANYPLTPDDLDAGRVPPAVLGQRHRLFGLTIDAERLSQIRQERRPNSRYADPHQCKREVQLAEGLYRQHRIPFLNTTHSSIEEIASKVMQALNLDRHLC